MTAPTPNAAQPESKRRWFSFSLRTLLIFVTFASCGLGWLGMKVQEGRRQQAAVAAIEKLGGSVGYDYQFDSQGIFVVNATPPGPAWLHSLLGDDFFRNVHSVGLGAASDAQDRFIRSGLAEYANTQLTDADLDCLKGLTHLKNLSLNASQVTDIGMKNLRSLAHLEVLYLVNTHVTDAGLDYLKGLAQLRDLDLYGTQVTDAGLANLQFLTRLEESDLGYTHVTDAGLDYLKGLTQLKDLRLYGTHVSDSGVAKLQQALPNCNILWR